jgi:hypothetical protein
MTESIGLNCMMPRAAALALALAAGTACATEPVKPPARTASATAPATASGNASATPGLKGLAGATRRADGALVISGTLSGQGTVTGSGTRVITGKVAPGQSPGCVSDQGNVVFEGGATLEIEIGGVTPCTQFDQYTVALKLRLNGPTLNVLLINGFVPAAGQRFDVLNWGTLSGSFSSVNLPPLPAGLQWDTSLLNTTGELVVNGPGSVPNDGDVPLPGWALGLLGVGMVMSAAVARRRRA